MSIRRDFTCSSIAEQIHDAVREAEPGEVIVVQPALWDALWHNGGYTLLGKLGDIARKNGVDLIKGTTSP